LSTDELHFVVKAFGDAVVAGEAPHGYDFFRPSCQGLAELYGWTKALAKHGVEPPIHMREFGPHGRFKVTTSVERYSPTCNT
jgi:hypothetical protein